MNTKLFTEGQKVTVVKDLQVPGNYSLVTILRAGTTVTVVYDELPNSAGVWVESNVKIVYLSRDYLEAK